MDLCPFRLANVPQRNLDDLRFLKEAECIGNCGWFISGYGCAVRILAEKKLGILKEPPKSPVYR